MSHSSVLSLVILPKKYCFKHLDVNSFLLWVVCSCPSRIFRPAICRPSRASRAESTWSSSALTFFTDRHKISILIHFWAVFFSFSFFTFNFGSNSSRFYLKGKGPSILSIMAKCSLLSCVWNKVMPKYSSNIMHPMLHTSHGWLHPSSKKENQNFNLYISFSSY
jgi:hypothetical protein